MDISQLAMANVVFALFFGALFTVIAKHMRIPAIVPLLLGGVVLGPEVLGLVDTRALGEGMRIIISLCVAIILFEGGLTLDPQGFRRTQGIIWRLLSIGVLVTWLGTTIIVHYLFGYSWPVSLLAGSLIIVTGPTVITPILKRVRVNERLNHILHWEGVLIDPIGVFAAVLCFEWISIETGLATGIGQFTLRLLVGGIGGLIGGKIIQLVLDREWVEEEQTNVFVLASALLLFGISDFITHESGILTVVVAGLVLGWQPTTSQRLKQLIQFKSELTEMAIGMLFILLAANLKLQNFVDLGWAGIALIVLLMAVVRPLGVLLSTAGSTLSVREKMFLSWLAPRGVVAGSMASLFALELSTGSANEAAFLEAFTFTVIGATVVIQGLSGGIIADWLGVREKEKRGWLIVGAHQFSRRIADFIQKTTDGDCILIDTNAEVISEAASEGYATIHGNALYDDSIDQEIIGHLGYVLALTDNRDLNMLICDHWRDYISADHLFRWAATPDRFKEKGLTVWTEIPKPSLVAKSLRKRDVTLVSKNPGASDFVLEDDASALIVSHKNRLSLSGFGQTGSEESLMLILEQRIHHLPYYISPERVLTGEFTDLSVLLKSALDAASAECSDLPADRLLTEMLDRERLLPTVLSNGVVVPHCRCDVLEEPVCVLVRAKNGLDLQAQDGELSRLFFVLITDERDPALHLILLSEVAKLSSNAALVKEILSHRTPEEALKSLRRELSENGV